MESDIEADLAVGGAEHTNEGGRNARRLAMILRTLQPGLLQGRMLPVGSQRDGQAQIAELQREITAQREALLRLELVSVYALARVAESREATVGQHLQRVPALARLLATALAERPGYVGTVDGAFVDRLYHASPLHDLGKVGIPDHILCKPGRLTDKELRVMRTHTLAGAALLEEVQARYDHPLLAMAIEIARWHHERWDGGGYPDGLRGTEIPLSARIVAVADVYESLRARRCYKEPYSHAQSAAIIRQGRGSQFDPDVVDAFLTIEDELERTWDALDEGEPAAPTWVGAARAI